MGALLDLAATRGRLQEAWDDVLASDLADGNLADGVRRFKVDANAKLDQLATELATGNYRPATLTRVELPKDDGDVRTLHIPSVRDRVVERSILSVVGPLVDPWLGPCSYGYRPGLGVGDAVQAIVRMREEGLRWVARADVHDCFPSLPVGTLRRMLPTLIDDQQLVGVIGLLLDRRDAGRRSRQVAGLPQGSPLSPLWANVLLVHLDERLTNAGFPVVRYADDFVAFAETRDGAWEAMRVASEATGELGMRLGADKSEVMSFDEGFCFLGEDFGPRYPPELDDHRASDPQRKVLYVGLQGSRVRVSEGRVIVESRDDQRLLDVPSGQLERLLCFGSVGVSAGMRSWALAHGVEAVFLSRRGSYLGHSWPAASKTRVSRLRAQLEVSADIDRSQRFARAVVEAKIRKQTVLLQRLGRRDTADTVAHAVGQLKQMSMLVPRAISRDELMGVEGAAARAYFTALGEIVPDELAFSGRTRQPPLDVVNAALSYGYAVLLGEAVSALCGAGLDPAIGLLHADDDNRPSLALDLMEEFRPLIIDQVVISAATQHRLRPEHGRREEGVSGVLLTRAGREILIEGYERRMQQMTRGALPGFSGSLRRHLYRQAERAAAYINGHEAGWTGMSWR